MTTVTLTTKMTLILAKKLVSLSSSSSNSNNNSGNTWGSHLS